MNRLQQRFDALRKHSRKALIPYITAGDPSAADTVRYMHALVRGGADVLELGVPFSDPMADGPVIQAACQRALGKGTSLRDTLDMVRRFREHDRETPVALMGYLNPLESMGYEAFAEAAAAADVDGVLTVDVTAEESETLLQVFARHELQPIFLLSPTTSDARVKITCDIAQGYLYYVSVKGTTGGGGELDPTDIGYHVSDIRKHTDLPVVVGFGIRDAQSAARVSCEADGVVVGSALVARIAEHQDATEVAEQVLEEQLAAMRAAMDQAAETSRTETAEDKKA